MFIICCFFNVCRIAFVRRRRRRGTLYQTIGWSNFPDRLRGQTYNSASKLRFSAHSACARLLRQTRVDRSLRTSLAALARWDLVPQVLILQSSRTPIRTLLAFRCHPHSIAARPYSSRQQHHCLRRALASQALAFTPHCDLPGSRLTCVILPAPIAP